MWVGMAEDVFLSNQLKVPITQVLFCIKLICDKSFSSHLSLIFV